MRTERKMRESGLMRCATVAVLVLSAVVLTGCFSRESIEFVDEGPELKQVANRRELLEIVQQDMDKLLTIKARANVELIKEDVLIPAGLYDEQLRRRGKPYNKAFLTSEVRGFLFLERGPESPRNILFKGSVVGANLEFSMLGTGDAFWIAMPNVNREDDPAAPRGHIYFGTVGEEDVRPLEKFSIRPQDMADLYLYDEVYPALRGDSTVFCTMEKWPEFYVLTFMRLDWVNPIFSRIWVERKTLHVAIHQLFDATGAVVAEGRFRSYRPFRDEEHNLDVELPTEAVLLWPRDHIVMEVTLDNVKVNEEILDRYWEPQERRGYKQVPLTVPDRDEVLIPREP